MKKGNKWKVGWEELKRKQRKGKKALLGRVEKETKESNNERCNRKIRNGKKDNEWKVWWEEFKKKKIMNERFDGKARKGKKVMNERFNGKIWKENKGKKWKVLWEDQKGKQR